MAGKVSDSDSTIYEIIQEVKVEYTLEQIDKELETIESNLTTYQNLKTKFESLREEMILAGVSEK